MNILHHGLEDVSLDEKEDIVQNTFSKLLKGGLRNFRGSSGYEFLAYFKRIVLNEAKTYMKSGKGVERYDLHRWGRSWRQGRRWRWEVRDGNAEPYGDAKRREDLQTIKTVLNGSPVETRQIVLMKIEGYKDREIARILGISVGTVASKYARMKERVKELFGPEDAPK